MIFIRSPALILQDAFDLDWICQRAVSPCRTAAANFGVVRKAPASSKFLLVLAFFLEMLAPLHHSRASSLRHERKDWHRSNQVRTDKKGGRILGNSSGLRADGLQKLGLNETESHQTKRPVLL